MSPHSMATQGQHQAAQTPVDPAVVTSQVFANVQSYYPPLVDAASPSAQSLHFLDQPLPACSPSLAHSEPSAFTFDPICRLIRPVKPYSLSFGIQQGFVPPLPYESDLPGGPWSPGNAVQSQTCRLLQCLPEPDQSQSEPVSKPPRKSRRRSLHQTGHSVKTGSSSRSSHHHPNPLLPQPTDLSLSNAATRSVTSPSATIPTSQTLSTLGSQADQSASLSTTYSREYPFLEYGQKDPTKRSLDVRSREDKERRNAISERGGACGPCQVSKKQCDVLDHCHRCVERGTTSEAIFFRSVQPTMYTPGLETVSLHDMQGPSGFKIGKATGPGSDTMVNAQKKVTDHTNSWFKDVTGMIDPEPFSFNLYQEVSLEITSGLAAKRNTSFKIDFLDFSTQLERTPYQLPDADLLAGFAGHASDPALPQSIHDHWGSRCATHLSWIVFNVFAFLKSFADAEMFASITSMPVARATISVIYASLYRLLLSKSDDLCLFLLKSFKKDFQYCTRRSRKDLINDSLQGLAQYYRVVTSLADLDLQCCSEAAALFLDLRFRARALLRNGGLEDLFLQIHARTLSKPAQSSSKAGQSSFMELVSSYTPEMRDIECLKVALRVKSQDPSLRPVPTEAIRDNDPHHHFRPIKVRDLLKESKNVPVDPKQRFIDDIVENFADLGHTFSQKPEPPQTHPLSYLDYELSRPTGDKALEILPTSLDPSHASIRPSQQDTDTGSMKSESTVQNDVDLPPVDPVDAGPQGKQVDDDWRAVLRGKGRKRRERSGDSQNARRHSGQGGRKYIRSDSGRQSPNYFGPLTDEPAALR